MRSIGGGPHWANRYPTRAISETSAICDASSRKATRGCALRGRIIVTTAVQAACLHGWHSSRRRRSRRHPAQAGRIWRAMQPNSLVGPSAWCSAAPLLLRWQWAGPSGPWGPVLIMAAGVLMCGCSMHGGAAGLSCPAQPCLASVQNTFKTAQFQAKFVPNRDRYVRYAASGGGKAAHLWDSGTIFFGIPPKISRFSSKIFLLLQCTLLLELITVVPFILRDAF